LAFLFLHVGCSPLPQILVVVVGFCVSTMSKPWVGVDGFLFRGRNAGTGMSGIVEWMVEIGMR